MFLVQFPRPRLSFSSLLGTPRVLSKKGTPFATISFISGLEEIHLQLRQSSLIEAPSFLESRAIVRAASLALPFSHPFVHSLVQHSVYITRHEWRTVRHSGRPLRRGNYQRSVSIRPIRSYMLLTKIEFDRVLNFFRERYIDGKIFC